MRRWIPAIAALFVSNLILTAYLWVPSSSNWPALLPIPETIGLFVIVTIWGGDRRLRIAIGVLLGILIGFSLTEAAFQFIYGRSFVPRIDIQMISGLLFLLFGEIGDLAFFLRPIVFLAILLLLSALGVSIVAIQRRAIINAYPSRPFLVVFVLAAGIILAFAGPPRSLAALATLSWSDDGTVEFVDYEIEEALPEETRPEEIAYRFPGILDRDIYIFVIEAYGYATFSRPDLKTLVDPARDRFADALEERDYEFRSNYYLSPVAGGFSWLAEATILTGQWIDSQNAFLQLYDARLPTLTGALQQGGYYTFTLKPGTVHSTWPEGWDLYRFEDSMVAFDGDFGYDGPWFSYVPITDQFTLWAAHQRITELRAPGGIAAERPLLAYYQLVSSHTPFNKIPPIIEEWDDLGDGSVYNERAEEIRYFDNSWGGGTEMDEGYSTAISYVFDALTKYITEKMDLSNDPLIIVFGDHQAQRPIREEDAHLSIPMHVASRDEEILTRFESVGFRPGLDGGQPPPHSPMSSFFQTFMQIAGDEPLQRSGATPP